MIARWLQSEIEGSIIHRWDVNETVVCVCVCFACSGTLIMEFWALLLLLLLLLLLPYLQCCALSVVRLAVVREVEGHAASAKKGVGGEG